MNNLHRIFIAINLPAKIIKELGDFQYRWPELPARWTKSENLHITVDFLGNASDQEVCDICRAMEQVCRRHEPFAVSLNRIVYAPPQKKPPRMVWAVGGKSPELGALQKDIESSIYDFCGGRYQEGEIYNFTPHITLARLRMTEFSILAAEEIPIIEENINRVFTVETIEVMESELKKGGPVYAILESFRLGCE